ncbi:two component system sensor kinase [Edwardsiella ictaluri]|uniref:two component system sensor kinase n=1 Tax=Edwardsiella ictaluri TaxID=67780 RepID=UPI003A598D66
MLTLLLNFEQTKSSLQRRLTATVADTAYDMSSELLDVSRDVDTLMRCWQRLDDGVASGADYLTARYIPDMTKPPDPAPRLSRAKAFVEAYGSGGLGNLADTFVLLDGGVVLSSAGGQPTDTPQHIEQIRALREQAVGNHIIWSKPYHSVSGNWRVIAAKRDLLTGALVGMTVNLHPSFNAVEKTPDGETIVWLDREGQPIIPLSTALSQSLPRCQHAMEGNFDEVFSICREVAPVGWRLLLFTPSRQITDAAFAALHRYLPVALLLLVTLVGLLYLVLQRTLGRTLAGIMQRLTPNVPVADLPPLMVAGEDELGRIAQVYNRLLSAVKAQYAQLEARVAERTVELERARRHAERASANKSEHLNSISHEIRTPLNGIIGALMLLENGESTQEQHDLLDTGLKCSRHLLEIINNLLDFSRIESGQMVVNPEYLEPLLMIDQAMLTVQLPALEKGLTLYCLLAPSFPQTLYTDGLRLRQILINLLGNAVKFTSHGEVVLHGWSEQDRLCFRVQDTGPGIDDARVNDIFTAFHQIDCHIAGSGLGLSIARSLSHLLGGELFCEKSAIGASFCLKLPLEVTGTVPIAPPEDKGCIVAPLCLHPQLSAWGYHPQAGDNPDLDAPELSYLPGRLRRHLDGETKVAGEREKMPVSPWSLQVLVVDDVDTNQDIVGRMLRQQGHKVYTASSGSEALVLGRGHIFDLVLMDMRMPGLSGDETLRLWRDSVNGVLDPDCPIIALTANAQPGERKRLQDAGFNEYLTKPVTPTMLSRALEYTADIQLTRGIELSSNSAGEIPLIGKDPALWRRLQGDVLHYLAQLTQAVAQQDEPEVRQILHTLKGLAGQGGLTLVHEAAARWEQALECGMPVPDKALESLSRLVHSEFEAD